MQHWCCRRGPSSSLHVSATWQLLSPRLLPWPSLPLLLSSLPLFPSPLPPPFPTLCLKSQPPFQMAPFLRRYLYPPSPRHCHPFLFLLFQTSPPPNCYCHRYLSTFSFSYLSLFPSFPFPSLSSSSRHHCCHLVFCSSCHSCYGCYYFSSSFCLSLFGPCVLDFCCGSYFCCHCGDGADSCCASVCLGCYCLSACCVNVVLCSCCQIVSACHGFDCVFSCCHFGCACACCYCGCASFPSPSPFLSLSPFPCPSLSPVLCRRCPSQQLSHPSPWL
mmetsp:Transcript_68223/g.120423  ORF Transcript_68223/g.120423 Transcript_68223/m.120423 type:complete len:274 (+) Transcript_68223:808-1629(+)